MKTTTRLLVSISKTSPMPCLTCSPSRSQAVNATFGHVVSSRLFAVWAALALVLTTGLASVKADTIIESLSGSGGYASGWLPQFNPTNGQLTNVVLYFSCWVDAWGQVYNGTPSDTSFGLSISTSSNDGSMSVSNSSFEAYGSGVGGYTNYGFVTSLLLGAGDCWRRGCRQCLQLDCLQTSTSSRAPTPRMSLLMFTLAKAGFHQSFESGVL